MSDRSILARVEQAGPARHLAAGLRNRMVVAPDRLEQQSPFVLLVEDFIARQAGFHPHPHRGLETVTFILEGHLEHQDHLGNSGVLGPGDVQWMTAGRGIMHGGKPHDGESVHALQLWLNLPAALKRCAPGTREQRKELAVPCESNGTRLRAYGAVPGATASSSWSRWPMSLTDVQLEPSSTAQLPITPGDRMFIYVLSGRAAVGSNGEHVRTGDVAWLRDCHASQAEPSRFHIRAVDRFRAIAYSGRPIAEPAVAQGPFVMTTEKEIREAYADLQAGTFLS